MNELEAKGRYVIVTSQLHALAAMLREAHEDALLVKGAALILTSYPQPWQRHMADIDVIARPGRFKQLVQVLTRAGYRPIGGTGRRFSHRLLAEQQLVVGDNMIGGMLEVHPGLDKVAPRSIDYDSLFRRSLPAPGLAPLLIPCPIDHILLVAQHASMHDFQHPRAYDDMVRLLEQGLDPSDLREQAERWSMLTVMYLMLIGLRERGLGGVSADLVSSFQPSSTRLRAIKSFYDLSNTPPRPRSNELGVAWVARQSALREDTLHWARGVATYALCRAADLGWVWRERMRRARS